MRFTLSVFISLASILTIFAQQITTPLEKHNYLKTTSYEELSNFVKALDSTTDYLKVEIIGQSVQARNLYALKFSGSEFGKNRSKIKVIFFAQQHGNEQSGKEGALLLANELTNPKNKYLFDKIDLVIIPQMNPDGSEINKRRNGNNADLNRNHLILTEPEVIALHSFFDKYQFEANMDIHEYSPYGEEWQKYGYRKNAEITLGGNTNINISDKIRKFSNDKIVPFFFDFLTKKGISSFIYSPGGPPEIDYIRHSTFDINDGRQSFGIQNTFSFIQEGKNGTDNYIENIKRRAETQMNGMLAMLEFIYKNKDEIKKLVNSERKNLISMKTNQLVSIQSEHIQNGKKLSIPLFSYFSSKDSVVIVNDYRPIVHSIYDVKRPIGYLIPKKLKDLTEWAGKQDLNYREFKISKNQIIEEYMINGIDSIDFEREIIVNPLISMKEKTDKLIESDYIYIPLNQIKGNLIVLALEPKSMLGLVTYKQFGYLLKPGETFPILRVIGK
jgi:hypothetical protein